MPEKRGNAERPLATQVENLLAGSPYPAAKWTDSKLSTPGYLVMIAGGGCVEVSYIDPDQRALTTTLSKLYELARILQAHYGDGTIELQRSLWRVEIDTNQLESDHPMIYVRLHWIRTM